MIHAAFTGGEPLVLDEHLVHDAAEVGAAAAVPGPLNRLDDIGDLHGLSAGLEDLLHGVVEALFVADAAVAAAAAAHPALDPIDLTVQRIQLPLRDFPLAMELEQLVAASLHNLLQLRETQIRSGDRSCHVGSFLSPT